jgi:hypothetical protein
MIFEVFREIIIQIVVFLVMTLYRFVYGYQRFGGNCCIHVLARKLMEKDGGRRFI